MDEDNLQIKFLALNVDFSSLNFGLLAWRSLPYRSDKYGYFFKMRNCCNKRTKTPITTAITHATCNLQQCNLLHVACNLQQKLLQLQ